MENTKVKDDYLKAYGYDNLYEFIYEKMLKITHETNHVREHTLEEGYLVSVSHEEYDYFHYLYNQSVSSNINIMDHNLTFHISHLTLGTISKEIEDNTEKGKLSSFKEEFEDEFFTSLFFMIKDNLLNRFVIVHEDIRILVE
jgi:hypothetical protein